MYKPGKKLLTSIISAGVLIWGSTTFAQETHSWEHVKEFEDRNSDLIVDKKYVKMFDDVKLIAIDYNDDKLIDVKYFERTLSNGVTIKFERYPKQKEPIESIREKIIEELKELKPSSDKYGIKDIEEIVELFCASGGYTNFIIEKPVSENVKKLYFTGSIGRDIKAWYRIQKDVDGMRITDTYDGEDKFVFKKVEYNLSDGTKIIRCFGKYGRNPHQLDEEIIIKTFDWGKLIETYDSLLGGTITKEIKKKVPGTNTIEEETDVISLDHNTMLSSKTRRIGKDGSQIEEQDFDFDGKPDKRKIEKIIDGRIVTYVDLGADGTIEYVFD